MTKSEKKKAIDTSKEGGVGSTNSQCILLTERINSLVEHLKIHKKDHSSRRGLFVLVGKRRGLLDYLKHKSLAQYELLVKSLNIRK